MYAYPYYRSRQNRLYDSVDEYVVRVVRGLEQRIHLLQCQKCETENGVVYKFVVTGTTGKIYCVNLHNIASSQQSPTAWKTATTCTCPDYEGRRCQCKHIAFVLYKVLLLNGRCRISSAATMTHSNHGRSVVADDDDLESGEDDDERVPQNTDTSSRTYQSSPHNRLSNEPSRVVDDCLSVWKLRLIDQYHRYGVGWFDMALCLQRADQFYANRSSSHQRHDELLSVVSSHGSAINIPISPAASASSSQQHEESSSSVFNSNPLPSRPIAAGGEKQQCTIIRKPYAGELCAICMDTMEEHDDLIWCQTTCGQSVHLNCFACWSTHRDTKACVYCRNCISSE